MTDPLEPDAVPGVATGTAATTRLRATGAGRQRPLAAIVVVAAVLVVVGLTAGPWAQTTFAGEDDRVLEVELDPSGSVHVRADEDTDPDLARRYEGDDNQAHREALREAVPGTAAELARVLAVLVAVVGAVGLVRDLTPHSWVLVAALAVACLAVVVLLRDEVTAGLATRTTAMGLADHDTDPTFWGGLTVGSAAVAALAAAFAAGPRPSGASPALEAFAEEAVVAQQQRRLRLPTWKDQAPHNPL